MCRAWQRQTTCAFQKTCLSEPQSQLHFFFLKKEKLVFICLFCIHFQLMLLGENVRNQVSLPYCGRARQDSNVSNALSRGKDNETFQLYCNCTCLPTAFIFTVDFRLEPFVVFLFCVCMWCSRSVFTFKQRCKRKHGICLAVQPSACQVSHQQWVCN